MWLANPVIAVLIATGVWWLSTGLVLLMVHWSIRNKLGPWQLLPLVTLVGVAGFLLLLKGSEMQTPLGSYAGFFGALLVWAWHETTFLTGMVTGRSKQECPPDAKGAARFVAAWKAVCDHEIALLVTAVFLWFVLADAPNTFGLATFGLLWGMRISAKLLIFLGARHAISGLMPPGIVHLKTYFNTGRTTPFFPLLLAIAVGLFAVLVTGAMNAHSAYSSVGHILLAAFMALAIIEHLILVLPVSDMALWRWAVPKGAREKRSNPPAHEFAPASVGVKRGMETR
ncbi:putative photosynthetic complex assembly protein PuhE [Roseibium alexandrii]|uniref:Putative photosynthetic complex assembly protein 2 n=1 Tax=Roseibium alexandrii (strain DSM 17067 / NCIMB 14079 / DFL-11) TaxID=244592 RepID=A0A5E8H5Y6_ROSAD|nr:putative photosynthetic complex assembly protein PuhE [Roseibium alexandrii]EEE47445.1 putative photosynthetic complex assembly protein 2 [Roseibium alexandrii DFL-11]